MVITRPPEIVACFYIVCPPSNVFVIFDSHPRPHLHPDGAAFIFNSSLEATASYLSQLLGYDPSLLADRNFQWQTQLLGQFSGHIFMSHNDPDWQHDSDHWLDAAIEASVQSLAHAAENSELKVENQQLTEENARLRGIIGRLERDARTQSVWKEVKQSYPASQASSSRPSTKNWMINSVLAAARSFAPSSLPFRSSSQSIAPAVSPSSLRRRSTLLYARTSNDSLSRKEEKARSRESDVINISNDLAFALEEQQRLYDEEREGGARAPDNNIVDVSNDLAFAREQQRLYDEESPPDDPLSRKENAHGREDDIVDVSNDLALALEQQRLYDEESQILEDILTELIPVASTGTFECNICFDTHSQEDVAEVDGCGHLFCRDCIRAYASNKLCEHLYPILCPSCNAEKSEGNLTGTLT